MARIPVRGVRTSWAKAASAASTTPGPDLRARAAVARLEERRFCGRFERFERVLAAMMLPAPGPLGTMAPWHAQPADVTDAVWVLALELHHESHQPADIGRRGACGPQFAQAGRAARLRELAA